MNTTPKLICQHIRMSEATAKCELIQWFKNPDGTKQDIVKPYVPTQSELIRLYRADSVSGYRETRPDFK